MKLSEALTIIAKTKTQTFTSLAEFDPKTGKPISYCLVGAIACQKGLIKNKEQMRDDFGDTSKYIKILEAYGIIKESIDKNYMKHIPEDLFGSLWGHYKWHPYDKVNLPTILWWLNDSAKITFDRAAVLIREWEDKNYIVYENENE